VTQEGPVPIVVNLPPEQRASLGAAWSRGRWLAGADASWVDEAFWADVQPYSGWTDDYLLVSARVGVDLGHGLDVALKGVNLTDERVQQHVFGDILERRVTAELRWAL
jgi:outer membrane receptor protein involved in Fe transport